MMRSVLICLALLLTMSMAVFADEKTTVSDGPSLPTMDSGSPITDDRSPKTPITENGDTIVITAEEIRTMQAHKMADVLNHVPGVTASDTSVGIRGVYKVKVFVDGRPINDPTASHGSVKWDLVSPHEVQRIEILRGKGGLRYGQDASGGVILITTQRVQRLTGNVKVYGGNHGTGYGYTNLQSSARRWSFGVSGGFESTDGYKLNNDKERWQAGARLAYDADEHRRLALTADYLEDERGLGGLPEYPTPFSRKTTDNTSLSLQAEWNPVVSTTYFNDGSNHNTDVSRGIDQTLNVSEWGEDLATTMNTGDWGKMSLGGAFRQGWTSGSNFDDQREETYSLFAAQTLHGLKDRLTLTAGLRANINSAFDDAANPEVKLTWAEKSWRTTAAYSRTNNTPSFRQRYNQSSSTRPNPDLTMETADNFSLSLFARLHDTFSGSVSLFHNRLTDRITYLTGDDGIGQYQNFGLVTYTGGDMAATWKPLDTIKIKTTYTYMEAIDEETDLWLPAKARHKVNLDLFWQPIPAFSVVLSGKHVSKVYRNKANTKTVPDYTLAGLRAEYAFSRFSLFTDIDNLFDATYYYADGLLAPPFTWVVGVNWRI